MTYMPPWPADGLEAVPRCPICKSDERHLMHTGLTDTVFRCAPGIWIMIECEGCGSGYLDPRPTQETMHLAYQKYYTHAVKSRAAIGTSLLPWKRKWADREYRHLPRPMPGARVLDVGCGNGSFLGLAKASGWQVFGCETDPAAAAAAREGGIEVRQGGIETYAEMSESFDVITLSHVIEHLPKPMETLRQAYHLLRPGGMLWLETPNIQSYGHANFGVNWRGLEPPRHLALFNWDSLTNILKETGFRKLRRTPYYDVYPRMAAKSRALAEGRSPYDKKTVRTRLVDNMYRLKAFMYPNRTEFITLSARKPV